MRCPFCKEIDRDKVIDSRLTEGGTIVRRRRRCEACGKRFTTKERMEEEPRLSVVKKDGTRVPFDRGKILAGLQKACYKRPVSAAVCDRLVTEVEEHILRHYDREVESKVIGREVSQRLRKLDQVAYVRFASVYRDFQDVGEFVDAVETVRELSETDAPGQGTLFD